MARIEGVPEKKAGWLAKLAFWRSRQLYGKVLEPAELLAHHPRLLAANGLYETVSAGSARVPGAYKHLAELRVSTQIGCPF